MLILPDQVTPKCLIDNLSPGILSVFTSHPMQSDKPWAQGYFLTGKRLKFMEYHQYNGRGRQVSWWSTATGPHASDLRVTHTAFHFLSLFPDITALMGVSLASWLACQLLGCTHRPASLVVAQAQDRRQSPETAPETSVVWCLIHIKQRILEQHSTMSGK